MVQKTIKAKLKKILKGNETIDFGLNEPYCVINRDKVVEKLLELIAKLSFR